ncbi:MAG: aminomethyltransferase family protein [Candidatus Saccharibacteria bacterium]
MIHNVFAHEIHQSIQAEMTNLGNFEVPLKYGDVHEEYSTLRNRVGIYDISCLGKFKVEGENAVDFLQKLLTKDIEYLSMDRSEVYLMLDQQGSIIDQVNVYNFDDYYLIECWPTRIEKVENWLNDNLIDNVRVSNITQDLAVISIEGPYSWKVLQRLIDFDVVALSYQSFIETEISGITVTISRTGYTAEYGYKLMINPSEFADLWNLVVQQEDLVAPVGLAALEICRTESRFAQLDDEAKHDEKVLEIGLNWMIDFNKEDYVGADALAEQKEDIKKRLVCFKALEQCDIPEGSSVYADTIVIGTVSQNVFSPTLDTTIGVAFLQTEFAAADLALKVDTGSQLSSIMTVSAPFITPKSWAIKME